MKKPYRARFRAYRRYRSEIWGDIIAKGKFTTIYKLLIKLFNLQFRIYLRKNRFFSLFNAVHFNQPASRQLITNKGNTKKTSLNIFKNNTINLFSKPLNFFVKSSSTDFVNSTSFIPDTFFKQNSHIVKNNNLFTNLINNFWFNLKCLKHFSANTSLNDNFFNKNPFVKIKKKSLSSIFVDIGAFNKFIRKKKIVNIPKKSPTPFYIFSPWYYIKKNNLIAKKYFSSPFFWVQRFNKLLRKWKYLKKSNRFRQKIFRKKFINRRAKKDRFRKMKRYYKITRGNRDVYRFQTWLSLSKKFSLNKWSKWWSLKIQQKKMALFYGIITKRKFKFINNLTFLTVKLQVTAALKLESTISIFLFRLNLFTNMYNIINFIKLEGCLLNNKIIVYPFRFIKIGDIITINKKYFNKLLNDFYIKFRRKYIYRIRKRDKKLLNTPLPILQYPPYIFANYKIMHFKFLRYPKKKEIVSPITFPFTSGGPDWSISTRSTY